MAHILVVDDSDTVRLEIANALKKANHDVIEAKDGRDGVHQCESEKPIDLIITDLNMPELDGISMVKEIRKMAKRADTPVFMLTTEASQELRADGKAAGVMVWIVKPFNAAKVLPAIDKVVAMKKAG